MTGTTIWLYRLPSLLGAAGAVLATYWCALALVERRGVRLLRMRFATRWKTLIASSLSGFPCLLSQDPNASLKT
jgi:4-amino-4-deoxy-L-arabinose transferase-like glycosyltransferase